MSFAWARKLVSLACLSKARILKCRCFCFFFFRWNLVCRPRVPSEDRGNWDKNRDDFHSMEMSLVMSMWFILGDDWNNAQCLSRLSAFLPCKKSDFVFCVKTGYVSCL